MEIDKSKTVILTDEQMKSLFNIQFVDCKDFKNSIYKYMPLSRVLEMLQDKEMAFIYPELWNDPYETKYLKTDYSAVGYHQKKVFCMCVRMDNDNEEASWKIYARPNEPLIKVTINGVKFLEYLKEYTVKNHSNLYISKVNYQYTTSEINSIWKKGTSLYDDYISGMDELKYIRLMSLKRQAFKYENERRLFIVPQQGGQIADKVLKVKIGLDMLMRFTINPCERIKDYENIISKLQISQYESSLKCIKNEIKGLYPEAKVYASSLYSSIKPIEKIEV